MIRISPQDRIVVTGGLYQGHAGTAVRRDGRTWVVKLDGWRFGRTVPARDLRPEPKDTP